MSFDSNSAPDGACKSDCASVDEIMDRIRSNIERFSPFEGPGRQDFRIYDVEATEPVFNEENGCYSYTSSETSPFNDKKVDFLKRCRSSTDGMNIINLGIEPEIVDLNKVSYTKEEIKKICSETGNLGSPDYNFSHKRNTHMSIDDIEKAVNSMCSASTQRTSSVMSQDQKELSGWNIAWHYNDTDVFKLAGVKHDKYDEAVLGDFRRTLLKYVASKELPKDIVLGITDNKLTVNGVSTKISSTSIEMAFCGLTDLIGEKKARKFVGDRIRRKLKKIF